MRGAPAAISTPDPTHLVGVLQHRDLGVVLLAQLLHDDLQHTAQLALHLGQLVARLGGRHRRLERLVDLRQHHLQRVFAWGGTCCNAWLRGKLVHERVFMKQRRRRLERLVDIRQHHLTGGNRMAQDTHMTQTSHEPQHRSQLVHGRMCTKRMHDPICCNADFVIAT